MYNGNYVWSGISFYSQFVRRPARMQNPHQSMAMMAHSKNDGEAHMAVSWVCAQLTCTYGPSLTPSMVVTVNTSVTNLNISYTSGYTAPPFESAFVNFSNWYVSLPNQPWPGVGILSSYTNVSVYSNDTIAGPPLPSR